MTVYAYLQQCAVFASFHGPDSYSPKFHFKKQSLNNLNRKRAIYFAREWVNVLTIRGFAERAVRLRRGGLLHVAHRGHLEKCHRPGRPRRQDQRWH